MSSTRFDDSTTIMASSFLSIFSKTLIMPNQGNKSNGSSGIAQKKKSTTMPSMQKKGSASAIKHSRDDNGQSASGSSGKGGSKTISNGSGNE
ncbi:MAG: hypothetical protein JWQ96_1136 [Segetibacter sp.]|nr:hypothetical protein [Segetibacter sp.]